LGKGKTTIGKVVCPSCGPVIPVIRHQNAPSPKGKQKKDISIIMAAKKKKLPLAPKIHISDEFKMMEGGVPEKIPGGEFKMISDPDADNKDEKYLEYVKQTAELLGL